MSQKHAVLVETSRRIAPFGDPVGDVLIDQRPLRERQRETLEQLGFATRVASSFQEIAPHDYPCLIATDDLYFSPEAIREFVRIGETSGSAQCVISSASLFARLFLPFHEDRSLDLVRLPLWYRRSPAVEKIRDVVLDLGEQAFPVTIPRHLRGAAEIAIPVCERPILPIQFAPDILFANIACLNLRFAQALRSLPRRLLLVVRARSTRPARVLARMNRIGPRCDIHPTACLEGATIGAGVQIGANAVIRMSTIGDGCHIGDGSVVKHSVVGHGSVLFDDLTLSFAVCYPETFLIHGPYHLSVFGRSSAMFATILEDFRLDGRPIRLERNGRLVPFPFPFIGSFIGHRTRVGGGAIIAPGRSIPNDLLILPSSDAVLSRIPTNPAEGIPLFIRQGTLQELDEPRAAEVRPVGAL